MEPITEERGSQHRLLKPPQRRQGGTAGAGHDQAPALGKRCHAPRVRCQVSRAPPLAAARTHSAERSCPANTRDGTDRRAYPCRVGNRHRQGRGRPVERPAGQRMTLSAGRLLQRRVAAHGQFPLHAAGQRPAWVAMAHLKRDVSIQFSPGPSAWGLSGPMLRGEGGGSKAARWKAGGGTRSSRAGQAAREQARQVWQQASSSRSRRQSSKSRPACPLAQAVAPKHRHLARHCSHDGEGAVGPHAGGIAERDHRPTLHVACTATGRVVETGSCGAAHSRCGGLGCIAAWRQRD